MASIRKRENKDGSFSYHVNIRKLLKGKTVNISQAFKDKKMALLWAEYKENLIDEMNAFDLPKEKLVRIKDLFAWKMDEAINDKKPATIKDLNSCKEFYIQNNIWDAYIHDITYEKLLECVEKNKDLIVYRGGAPNSKKGKPSLISPLTLKRKISILSTLYSCAARKGIPVNNICVKVIAYYKENGYWQ